MIGCLKLVGFFILGLIYLILLAAAPKTAIVLEADLENNKNFISASMRAFEKMVEAGHIEQAMILHERVISRLSGRASVAANKFNQNNPDGQVKFYTT